MKTFPPTLKQRKKHASNCWPTRSGRGDEDVAEKEQQASGARRNLFGPDEDSPELGPVPVQRQSVLYRASAYYEIRRKLIQYWYIIVPSGT